MSISLFSFSIFLKPFLAKKHFLKNKKLSRRKFIRTRAVGILNIIRRVIKIFLNQVFYIRSTATAYEKRNVSGAIISA